jgi:transposase InsO family protein
MQTDNGSEFSRYAHEYLKANNLTYFFNSPDSPKNNAFIERYNRTVKEQFVNRKENCIENCDQDN